MDREEKIEVIVNDLEDWLARDEYSFWEHVRELERNYLRSKDDKELEGIYENSVD